MSTKMLYSFLYFLRCGDIDPTVIQFIARKKSMSLDEVHND